MQDERGMSDSLEGGLDKGIDSAMSAKSALDAAKGTSAAGIGEAAASGATSAGTSTSAGAAAGTAAGGPAGTVVGAAVGLTVGIFAKPLIKAIIVILIFVLMVFNSLPSMFWEEAIDVADNTGPLAVYDEYRSYVFDKYFSEMESQKVQIESDFQKRITSGEFDDYDHVEYSYSFIPTEDVFLTEILESSSLIVALFEVYRDDWRKASFNDFKNTVDSVYFWNSTIACDKDNEERAVTYKYDSDKDREESTIHISMTFQLTDVGITAFRDKFHLTDDRDYLKAVELFYNTRLFFGEIDELPMGGVTGGGLGSNPGGGSSGTYPGGGTHNAIRIALAGLNNPMDFFGGSAMLPLPSGTWYISSEFGPRNYAPDPLHTGLDFRSDLGTPIYSVMDGTILLRLTSAKSFGHHIVVYHGGGITTMYAHMLGFGSYNVGDTVIRGSVIGYVGSTGLSTGPHLHIEYQKNGVAHNPRLLLPF